MSFTLSDGAEIKLRNYQFVEPHWRPPAEDPPLLWTRFVCGDATTPEPEYLMPGMGSTVTPEGPDGPTVVLAPSIYEMYRQMLIRYAATIQQAADEASDTRPDLRERADRVRNETPSETRTMLVKVEVR